MSASGRALRRYRYHRAVKEAAQLTPQVVVVANPASFCRMGAVIDVVNFAGVIPLGCTIGQGLAGLSALALGAMIAFFAIVGGCIAAVKYQPLKIGQADSP
jgi:hypothetical protein